MLAWQYLTTADQRIKLAKRVLSLCPKTCKKSENQTVDDLFADHQAAVESLVCFRDHVGITDGREPDFNAAEDVMQRFQLSENTAVGKNDSGFGVQYRFLECFRHGRARQKRLQFCVI